MTEDEVRGEAEGRISAVVKYAYLGHDPSREDWTSINSV